jgi:hypothetical protein
VDLFAGCNTGRGVPNVENTPEATTQPIYAGDKITQSNIYVGEVNKNIQGEKYTLHSERAHMHMNQKTCLFLIEGGIPGQSDKNKKLGLASQVLRYIFPSNTILTIKYKYYYRDTQ